MAVDSACANAIARMLDETCILWCRERREIEAVTGKTATVEAYVWLRWRRGVSPYTRWHVLVGNQFVNQSKSILQLLHVYCTFT